MPSKVCKRHSRQDCKQSSCRPSQDSSSSSNDTTATDALLWQTVYNPAVAAATYDGGSSGCNDSSSAASYDSSC